MNMLKDLEIIFGLAAATHFWVEEIKLNLELKSATLTARSRQNRNHACKLKSKQSLDLRNYSKLPRPGK